ncbi:MAG: ABC transporter substrate-binding protein [Chthonomonas sp.]|nr:ABC transporter substrate-binding protein [Chthonomonas sp.]
MLNKLALLAISGAALLLAGCGSTEKDADTTGASTSSGDKPKFKITVSLPAADHGWVAGAIWWAEEGKTKHAADAEITIQTADSPGKQVNDLETMMATKPDAMVVLATESKPLTPVAKKIHDAGILLVNVDRGFDEPVADLFIQGDNKGFGRVAAEFIAEKLGGKGNILVLEGVPCTVNTDRNTAFQEVMKGFPDIKILDSQPGDWRKDKALNVTQTMLVKHPEVNAIWAADDDMALGAEQACKEAGKKDIWIVGGGGMKDIVKRIMDGDPRFPATVTYSPKMVGDAIDRAVEMLKKKEKPTSQKDETINVTLVKPDNAKDHYYPKSVY